MIRLPDVTLARATQSALDGYQREVNAHRSYPKRVTAARELWERHSKNKPFEPVKDALASMCCGALRCVYCEDSAADEVEHVRPKALYPAEVFSWPNCVYACGPCNGPKNNLFAVFPPRAKKPLSVARKSDDPVKAPAAGAMVLVDPRAENPLEYLWLDLDTFFFTENAEEGTRAWERGRYTIETLRLNVRPLLPRARESAFGSFRARLKEYAAERDRGARADALLRRRNELLRMHHITVFAEMQRQHVGHPDLKALFAAVPEALAWKPLHWEGGRCPPRPLARHRSSLRPLPRCARRPILETLALTPMGTAARLVIHTACSLALLAGCGVTASPSVGRPYDTRPDEPYPPLEDVYTPPSPDAEEPAEDSSPAPDAPASDAPSARPEAGPPYPVLLHHGFAGFRDIGPLNYFYNVARDLRSRGETVYESEVSPFLPPERRAYELAMVVDRIRRETGRDRVVLIGHSQGGLDARYMISTMGYGSRVAVLATVATPHRGTYVADALLNRVPSLFDPFLSGLLTVIGFTYNQVGTNAEARATLEGLSEARAEQFNRDNPDDPSVVYWSWTGRSNRRRGDSQCGGARYENDPTRVDDINPLLSVFASVLEQGNQDLHVNDGMVEVRSARWGLFMGCVPADHFDEVGQIARSGAVPGSGFDHLVFYRSIVQQARDAGF